MTFFLRLAVLIVRGWTHLYTLRLSSADQALRRDVIHSDIWEYLHDPDRGSHLRAARHVPGRAIRGIPDDLRWRAEQTRAPYLLHAAVALTVLLLVAAGLLTHGISMPPLPPSRQPAILALEVPPPPPPPPEKQGGRHDRDYWRSRR
jgi:hypothetical protein